MICNDKRKAIDVFLEIPSNKQTEPKSFEQKVIHISFITT